MGMASETSNAESQAPPPDDPHPSRRDWGFRRLVAGTLVGLGIGGLVGVVEPVIQMWPVRDLMTPSLWFDALSFSILSHVVAWTAICAAVCIVAALPARLSRWFRSNFLPAPSAAAGLVVGLTIVIVWPTPGHPASLAWAMIVWGVGTVPIAWLATWLARTVVGTIAAVASRVLLVCAVLLCVGSVWVQWQGRPRAETADCFRPALALQPTSQRRHPTPDVIFIVFDTLRVDRLGCYGYDRPTSPNIDAFARNAVRFTKAISPAVWTPPAHASMFTGLCCSQHGVSWAWTWLEDRFQTMAEILSDRRHETMALSNNPYVSRGTNLVQGFQRFADPTRLTYTTRGCLHLFLRQALAKGGPMGSPLGRWFLSESGSAATVHVAEQWLADRNRAKPLLFFVNMMDTHRPYEPTRDYRRRFVAPDRLDRSYAIDQTGSAVYNHMLAGGKVYAESDIQTLSDLYDARTRELDDHFAAIMGVVARHVDLDNALVILTSDHGENLGEHGMLDHQYCIYNTLVHVPLIVRFPRTSRPSVVERVVQTSDIFPTVLAAVGADLDRSAKVMARSLTAAMKPDPTAMTRYAVSEYLRAPTWPFAFVQQRDPGFSGTRWQVAFRAIFDGRWKLVRRSDGRADLFDLAADPGEERDVSGEQRVEKIRLGRMLDRWQQSFKLFDPTRATGPNGRRMDAEQHSRLRDLGYLQ